MADARTTPPNVINGSKVVKIDDYQLSISKNKTTGATTPIDIPKSNVLVYTTEDGSRTALRPSGTEPKIKYYMSVNSPLASSSEFKNVEAALDGKIAGIMEDFGVK